MGDMRNVQPYTDPNGRKWRPYLVDFTSPDGTFTVEVWAISMEHAAMQVEALRETATLKGELISTTKPGPQDG